MLASVAFLSRLACRNIPDHDKVSPEALPTLLACKPLPHPGPATPPVSPSPPAHLAPPSPAPSSPAPYRPLSPPRPSMPVLFAPEGDGDSEMGPIGGHFIERQLSACNDVSAAELQQLHAERRSVRGRDSLCSPVVSRESASPVRIKFTPQSVSPDSHAKGSLDIVLSDRSSRKLFQPRGRSSSNASASPSGPPSRINSFDRLRLVPRKPSVQSSSRTLFRKLVSIDETLSPLRQVSALDSPSEGYTVDIHILSDLHPDDRDDFLSETVEAEYATGTVIMREGDPCDFVAFIISGDVIVQKSSVEIAHLHEGSIMGEMGVLLLRPRSATVLAKTDVQALYMSADQFLAALDRHPEIYRRMLDDMMTKFQSAQIARVRQSKVICDAVDVLSRALPSAILKMISNSTSAAELLAGRMGDAALLFFDIREFSTMAERMTPQDLLTALNDHLQLVTQTVERCGGVIINFIGDAVLASFNVPSEMPDPASAVLSCYQECRKELHHATIERTEAGVQGKQCFKLGAGLHYGAVIAGAIGCENHFAYNLLGEQVNMTMRLEGLTRAYPVNAIISECVFDRLTEDLKSGCVLIDIREKEVPSRLYALREDVDVDNVAEFERALGLAAEGRVMESQELLRSLSGTMVDYHIRRKKSLSYSIGSTS